MKVRTPSLTSELAAAERPSVLPLVMDLFKARLTSLVLLTTLVGFYLGAEHPMDFGRLLSTLVGTGLLAAGAAALNQFLERDHDAKMPRTQGRPLPSGKMQPETALVIGGGAAVAGLICLAATVNLLTASLGALTLVTYLFLYTPLKRVTSMNTVIGAIPGALPPLMGWTAARGEVTIEGWSLFAILFFWQLPHFLAIAWMYREEYARAGFVMLPCVDPEGLRTGRQAISHTLGLIPISLCPFLFRMEGMVYCVGAMVLSAGFLFCAIQFARHLSRYHARQLFLASILYLPLLLGLMVFDKIR